MLFVKFWTFDVNPDNTRNKRMVDRITVSAGVDLILLDSPSGKEIDQANVKMMMDILKRDFSDHQIIIASIVNYNFDKVNIIEIKERLIEIESK